MSCTTNKHIDVQGHRGCRGILPENSLPAFDKAMDLGVNTLELDIAITKDNKVVISHEPYMNHVICTRKNGVSMSKAEGKAINLYDMTYEEIKEFDCGFKAHPDFSQQQNIPVIKPLLTDLFKLIKQKNSKVHLNIEIKSKPEYYEVYTPNPKDYVALVLHEIVSANMFHRTNLQSFDVAILEEVKTQAPTMPVALLIDEDESIEIKRDLLSFEPEIISPYFKLLDETIVKHLQNQNYKIIPWTVNTKPDMENMLNMKIDGIITDYPNLLLDLLRNL